MNKYLTLLVGIFVFSIKLYSQSATCPALITNNYTVTCSTPCVKIGVGATINLNGTESYTVTSIPYTPYSYTTGTDATYGGTSLLYGNDDYYGDAVTFFNFCFFGNTYNQIVLGSNDNATFDVTQANNYDPWEITGPLPGAATGTSNTAVDDAIMFPWNDIYSDIGTGSFKWQIYGTAPCRQFVYSCNDVPLFDGTAYCVGLSTTAQMVLYESTNIIDIYIGSRTSCPDWNSGWALTGICNATGSAWAAAPGENATTFNATNEAWRFTPNGASAGWTYTWYDTTMTAIGTGDSITVCPSAVGNTKYYVQGTSIACSGVTLLDSVIVTQTSLGSGSGAVIYSVTATNPTVCGDNDGTISLIGGIIPSIPDTVYYDLNGVPQPPVYTTANSDSTIVLTGLIAGVYTNIEIFNGSGCPSIVSATLVNPPISASFSLVQHLGCTGDTVMMTNTSTPAGFTSYWNFGDGSPIDSTDTDPTHYFIITGTHTITLVYSTYHTCYDTVSQTISFDQILSPAFAATPDSICIGSSISFNNSTVSSSTPTYVWNFGDGTYDSTSNPTHTYNNAGVFNVLLTATQPGGCQSTVNEQVDVVSISLAAAQSTLTLCNPKDSVMLSVAPTTVGNVPNISYIWTPATGLGEPTSSQTHFFDTSAPNVFNYYITSSVLLPSGNTCSSSTSINVTSYELHASFSTNYDTICIGNAIQFNNGTEYFILPNYTWTFNDGNSSNVSDPLHTFNVAGVYQVLLTVVDANSCLDTAIRGVNVMSVKARTYTHDTSVCLVNPMFLTATVDVQPDGFGNLVTYQWSNVFPGYGYQVGSPNDTITTFFGEASSPFTEYQFYFTSGYTILNSGEPCYSNDTEDIYVYPPDTLRNVTQNITIQYGNSVQLNADSAYYFWWTPDNGTLNNPNINNPIATPKDSVTIYTVYGLTQYGCIDSAKVTITVIPDAPNFIPSAFSPNGDGLNDQFKVGNIGFTKLVEMRIFNRWGDQVFETINPELGWDGTWKGVPQDIGTYFYEVILANPDGTQMTYKGDLTLIR